MRRSSTHANLIFASLLGAGGCSEDSTFPYWAFDGGPHADASSDVSSDVSSDTITSDAEGSDTDGTDTPADDASPDTAPRSDGDGDGVPDEVDIAPSDSTRCGDDDADGCDDCSVTRSAQPMNDGFDPDGDGHCELALDPACLHGEFAADDPLRREACELHALGNADRAYWTEEGGDAPALEWDETIWIAALRHSQDMCARDYFEHESPDGLGAGARMADLGVSWAGWGENISLFPTPLTIEYAFMAEPTCTGHRANILAPGFDRAASALYLCDNPGSAWFGYPFTTQNFVADRGLSESAYCRDPALACEDVPDPVSVARQWCRAEGSDCSAVDSPAEWDCPRD